MKRFFNVPETLKWRVTSIRKGGWKKAIALRYTFYVYSLLI
jgi:hypothetical protein